MEGNLNMCTICGEYVDFSDFEMSDEVCKWCNVVIRDMETYNEDK